jgi:hypothetical protein
MFKQRFPSAFSRASYLSLFRASCPPPLRGQLRCSRRSCGAVLVQRKVTQRKHTPAMRSPGILPCESAKLLRGSLTARPCADIELGAIHRAHPSGLSSAASPHRRGPVSARRARQRQKIRAVLMRLALDLAPPFAAPSIAGCAGETRRAIAMDRDRRASAQGCAVVRDRRSREAQGTSRAARGAESGVHFSWLLLFVQAKRSDPLAGREWKLCFERMACQ